MQSGSSNIVKVKDSSDVGTIIICFISVIGKIQYQCIFVLKQINNLVDHRVVLACGIVIVCVLLGLFFSQLWSLVIINMESFTPFGVSLSCIYVLTDEMKKDEI